MNTASHDWQKWPPYVQRRVAQERAEFANPSCVKYTMTDDEKVDAKDVVAWIYGVLTTLDGKASALMRLNGVLIAAATFLLGLFQRQGGTILSTTNLDAILIISSAFLSAVSIGLCLFVVNVSWSFLGKVTGPADKVFELSEEIKHLDIASTFRQRTYRSAWWISLLASFGFLAEFGMQLFYIIYSTCAGKTPWS